MTRLQQTISKTGAVKVGFVLSSSRVSRRSVEWELRHEQVGRRRQPRLQRHRHAAVQRHRRVERAAQPRERYVTLETNPQVNTTQRFILQ